MPLALVLPMLRITKITNGDTTLLKLEGTLREAWLEEVRHEASHAQGCSSNLSIDLSDVTFADAAGIALLGQMLREGVQVVAASGFIATSLGLETP